MSVYKICDILHKVVNMKLFFNILLVFSLFGCQAIENKADKIGKKEIKEVSKFLQQPEAELKIEMGEPDKILNSNRATKFFIYEKKNMALLVKKSLKLIRMAWL